MFFFFLINRLNRRCRFFLENSPSCWVGMHGRIGPSLLSMVQTPIYCDHSNLPHSLLEPAGRISSIHCWASHLGLPRYSFYLVARSKNIKPNKQVRVRKGVAQHFWTSQIFSKKHSFDLTPISEIHSYCMEFPDIPPIEWGFRGDRKTWCCSLVSGRLYVHIFF